MKKRVKLLTTIASLCLAVALMAFGVYAASSSTLTVNSTISFESNEVQVKWSWSVSGGDLASAISDDYTTTVVGDVDDYEVTLGTRQAGTDGELNTDDDTFDPISFDTTKLGEGETGGIITYVITCENISAEAVAVTQAGTLFTADTNTTVTYYVDATGGSSTAEANKKAWNAYGTDATFHTLTAATNGTGGGKISFIVTVELVDPTLSLAADMVMAPTFTAEKATTETN